MDKVRERKKYARSEHKKIHRQLCKFRLNNQKSISQSNNPRWVHDDSLLHFTENIKICKFAASLWSIMSNSNGSCTDRKYRRFDLLINKAAIQFYVPIMNLAEAARLISIVIIDYE